MSEPSAEDVSVQWQTGAYLVVGSIVGGIVLSLGLSLVQSLSPRIGMGIFSLGVMLAFVLASNVLYGR